MWGRISGQCTPTNKRFTIPHWKSLDLSSKRPGNSPKASTSRCQCSCHLTHLQRASTPNCSSHKLRPEWSSLVHTPPFPTSTKLEEAPACPKCTSFIHSFIHVSNRHSRQMGPRCGRAKHENSCKVELRISNAGEIREQSRFWPQVQTLHFKIRTNEGAL